MYNRDRKKDGNNKNDYQRHLAIGSKGLSKPNKEIMSHPLETTRTIKTNNNNYYK